MTLPTPLGHTDRQPDAGPAEATGGEAAPGPRTQAPLGGLAWIAQPRERQRTAQERAKLNIERRDAPGGLERKRA